ncbi:MAG: 30S ribosomal protein S20 [Patescibacteria group bacterium]
MPITKQASKKLRHDRVRTKQNTKIRHDVDMIVKKARKSPTAKTISAAFQILDKATKAHSIHKNAAARTKSRLSKLFKK